MGSSLQEEARAAEASLGNPGHEPRHWNPRDPVGRPPDTTTCRGPTRVYTGQGHLSCAWGVINICLASASTIIASVPNQRKDCGVENNLSLKTAGSRQ